MFALLAMDPNICSWHWPLVTLTAGVGGQMLSIGSAASVALTGRTAAIIRFSHLKLSRAILLSCIAYVLPHYWVKGEQI